MNTRTMALLLVLMLMLSLLAGCGSGSSAAKAESNADVSGVSESEDEADSEETAAEAVEMEVDFTEEVELPLEYVPNEEELEVSVLFQFPAFFQGFFPEGWSSSPWWSEFGARTNTSWTLREVSNLAWQENVNLLCASGDLPDLVTNLGSVYNGGLSQAIRDEMIIDIAPLIKDNAPFYYQAITADE